MSMIDTITLRPVFGKVLSIATGVVILICLGTLVVQADFLEAARFALPLLTIGYLVFLAFWAPAVEIGASGVRLRNVFSTVALPWSAIERIDTKYALTLYTREKRFVAWAAPASGRHRMMNAPASDTRHLPESSYTAGTIGQGDLPDTASGDAATIVRRQWDSLRDAGELAAGATSSATMVWHPIRIVVLIVLIVASAAAFV